MTRGLVRNPISCEMPDSRPAQDRTPVSIRQLDSSQLFETEDPHVRVLRGVGDVTQVFREASVGQHEYKGPREHLVHECVEQGTDLGLEFQFFHDLPGQALLWALPYLQLPPGNSHSPRSFSSNTTPASPNNTRARRCR